MKRSIVPLGVALAILIGRGQAEAQEPAPEVPEGVRVVLIGGTMIERDQEFGYLETRWTCRKPDRPITFRNLGWSGDTVRGPSRAGFGSTADGFQHLKDHVLALRPTILVVGYGGVEGFDGPAGVEPFRQGLDTLLDALEPAQASLVLLSPNRQEDFGPPLPDPTRHNADLALYRDVLRAADKKRWSKYGDQKRFIRFVNLLEDLPDGARETPRHPLTDNGLHFNAYGYWRAAAMVDQAVNGIRGWSVSFEPKDNEGRTVLATNNSRQIQQPTPIPGGFRFQIHDFELPPPLSPDGSPCLRGEARQVRAANLEPGPVPPYKVDGKRDRRRATPTPGRPWVEILTDGPEFDQAEALRRAIIAKNELYFYRWRPQNETYLFGFRKHEQGQNAREIPQFDPLVAAKEAEIARLRVPVPHVLRA